MRSALPVVALACLGSPVAAIRRLDLMAAEGEAAGKYAFEGGEPEGTCKACVATMEHIERQMAEPYYDSYYGGVNKIGRGVDSRALNKLDRMNRILDATRCKKEMEKYDLGHMNGENVFIFKKGDSGMNYPVHMELNDWAKNELGLFCESLLEEYEEQLTEILEEADANFVADGSMSRRVCKEQLALCVPPPPPPPPKPPKKEKKKSRKQRLEEARTVFKQMDLDSDGFITREEMFERFKSLRESGQSTTSEDKDEEEVDRFYKQIDKDQDGRVNFYEYKFMWVEPKNKLSKGEIPGAESGGGRDLSYFIGSAAAGLCEEYFPELTESVNRLASEQPEVLLGGLGVSTAALLLGTRAIMSKNK